MYQLSASPVRLSRPSRTNTTSVACAVCAFPVREKGAAKLASAAMLSILSFYRKHITDFMPPNCRFLPSCSKYMIEAITTYGAYQGFILSAWRVIRCNPTGGAGYDPVQWPPVSYKAGTW